MIAISGSSEPDQNSRFKNEIRCVKRVLLLAGDHGQPVVRLPPDKGLGDETIVVIKAVFKRLLSAVALDASTERKPCNPFPTEFGLRIQPQPEAIARLLKVVPRLGNLRVAILILVAESQIPTGERPWPFLSAATTAQS